MPPLALLAGGVVLTRLVPPGLVPGGIASYPALHTALETISIAIAVLVVAVGWHAHSRRLPRSVVLLATAFLGVAVIDFSHMLSYAGMPEYVTPADPEKAIGFWLAARLLASVALLATAAVPWRTGSSKPMRLLTVAAVLGYTGLVHLLLLFRPEWVPRTFVPGQGLTPFKIGFEMLLVAIDLAAAALLASRMRRPQPFDAASMLVCVCAMAASELLFMQYAQVTDLYNLMGHVCKVVSFLYLYRAVFVETVERPYKELAAAQARLHAIVQTIPDAVWLKDLEGKVIDCNPAVERFADLPREAIVGHGDEVLGPDAQVLAGREHDRQALAAGGPVVQSRSLRVAGELRPFEIIKTPLLDAQGRIVGVLGIGRDMSELLHEQDALRVSELRLRQAVRAAQIGIFDHDHVGETIYWSPEQRRHYGFGPDEPVSLAAFIGCVHPEDRSSIADAVARAHDPAGEGLFDVEHRVVHRDGQVRLLSTRSQTFFAGEGAARHKTRTVGAVIDVTELRAAEQALRLRDEALRTSLNAVAMADVEGRVTYVNQAFAQLWVLPDPEAALGRPVTSFWAEPERAAEVIRGLTAGQGPWRGELVGLRADGRRVDIDVWASMAVAASGEPIGMMASFLDIGDRKRAQAELERLNATLEERVQQRTRELARRSQDLVRAEKLAALGSLVAGVAHELNTPIGNAVMVASTLNERQHEFEAGAGQGLRRASLESFLAATREIGAVLERNLQRAAELIGAFKQLAVDQSSHQRRRFELAEVVSEVALTLRPTLRARGVTLLDETPPGLVFDSYPGPLGQVLINLINNAVQHAFERRLSGTVSIAAQTEAGGMARVTVADDGCGIPDEHINHIFDPFFTTRLGQGGSGLGLHIAYTLVTGPLGGSIQVAAVRGQGTCFTLLLPMAAPRAEAGAAAAHALEDEAR